MLYIRVQQHPFFVSSGQLAANHDGRALSFPTCTPDYIKRYTNTLLKQYLSMAELLRVACVSPRIFDVGTELDETLESVSPAFTACKSTAPAHFFLRNGTGSMTVLKNHALEVLDVGKS